MKNYRVRIIAERIFEADNEEDAIIKANESGLGVEDYDAVDVVHEYRMLVRYNCCEEGHTYGYEYGTAKDIKEAKFIFMSQWEPDVEASPCFDDIEVYDEEYGEWL